ncbi:MAG: hypothetical protein Q7V40_01920 [Pseudolabrys sp.]|nr:hypothetical protein [Pseudolabrys sp.]
MDDDIAQQDLARHELVRLEAQIETLTDQLAWCAKISLAAKIAIGIGALWFVLALVGVLPFGAATFAGTIAAILGGIVLLGSNATTWDQAAAARRETEAARRALIGQLSLRLVDDAPRTLH